jgi:hypothetical protein
MKAQANSKAVLKCQPDTTTSASAILIQQQVPAWQQQQLGHLSQNMGRQAFGRSSPACLPASVSWHHQHFTSG